MKQITHIRWFLMDTSFPDLNWARLRLYSDGSADIFDCDGKLHQFSNEEEAHVFLSEDEFVPFEALDEEDEQELGCKRQEIQPPVAVNDKELQPKMLIRRRGV